MVGHRPWSALSCVSSVGSLYYPILKDLIVTQTSFVVDLREKRANAQPDSLWTPQRRCSFLGGSKIREQFFYLACSLHLSTLFFLT